jgi:hypothetical protein
MLQLPYYAPMQRAAFASNALPAKFVIKAMQRQRCHIYDVCHDMVSSRVVALIIQMSPLLREDYAPMIYVSLGKTPPLEVLYASIGQSIKPSASAF